MTPGCVVLDLGAGLGIHGLLAAAAGAREVVLLDPSPVVDLGGQIAAANGLEGRVRVLRQRVEELASDARFDLLISVFTGHFLLTEDLLPLLFRARDRFLKPGGVLLPGRARMQVALAHAAELHYERVARWSDPILGLNFDAVRPFAANTVHFVDARSAGIRMLSGPAQLMELDFATARSADCRSRVALEVAEPGLCHGVLGWFDMQLVDAWLSTGPQAEPTHWSQAFLPLDPPVEVGAGDTLAFELDRPEYGEWTWTVTYRGTRQRKSTFHARRADLAFLKKQQGEHVPGVSVEGEIAWCVLRQMREGHDVASVIAETLRCFPDVVARDPELPSRLRRLVDQWARH